MVCIGVGDLDFDLCCCGGGGEVADLIGFTLFGVGDFDDGREVGVFTVGTGDFDRDCCRTVTYFESGIVAIVGVATFVGVATLIFVVKLMFEFILWLTL